MEVLQYPLLSSAVLVLAVPITLQPRVGLAVPTPLCNKAVNDSEDLKCSVLNLPDGLLEIRNGNNAFFFQIRIAFSVAAIQRASELIMN